MNYISLLLTLLITLLPAASVQAGNRGIPPIRNFSAREFNAHNRSFDVACDDYGSTYFANFEGLLYYDGSSWRKMYTPGISRVTRVVMDRQRNRIWFGGFNAFGYIESDSQGRLKLHAIANDANKNGIGEVDMIKLTKEAVYVHTLNGHCYVVTKDRLLPYKGDTSFIELNMGTVSQLHTQSINLRMPEDGGFEVTEGRRKTVITEDDGLCTNSVNFMMYDRRHTVWGATDHGVFAVEIPSPYSLISEGQGLRGEVYSIARIAQTLYVGTLQGLYRVINGKVYKVSDIPEACWHLQADGSQALMASTATGLYRVTENGTQHITRFNTLASCRAPQGGYYVAEIDSVFYVSATGKRSALAAVEKGSQLRIADGKLHVETINGQKWVISLSTHKAELIRAYEDFSEPKIEYVDELGRKWVTDPEGKDLSLLSRKHNNNLLKTWTRPLAERAINAVFCDKTNSLWVGGDFGLINFDLALTNKHVYSHDKEQLFIRQIVTVGDSVLWGGYSPKTMKPLSKVDDIDLPASMRMVTIYFSSKSRSIFAPEKYRYRLNGGSWSQWSTATNARFNNMSSGYNVFEVQCMDFMGNISNTATVKLYIAYPFYLQWWAIIIYILILVGIVRTYTRWRQEKLLRDKAKLETTVMQRTQELTTALNELERTQSDLVRMERTATAGKLTEGLIDRILNPLNYINNFSKLTSGLAKDLREDIEDEKDNMSEDNYEDCQDIIDMMTTNLGKIEDHGVNTTRTLRAMEAMLHTKAGTMRDSDVAMLCRKVAEVAADYHKKEIADCHISFTAEVPEGEIHHDIDPESIKNTLMALFSNAFYAVARKYQHEAYAAEVTLRLVPHDDGHMEIIVHDNGIGIEEGIRDKVFDPFFTTKPTGDAAGVGLYLAREIIQDHKGSITIESEKDKWTNVVISLFK